MTSIMPKKGPRSGGTSVVIKGTNLDTGSDVSVTVDGGTCVVQKSVYNTLHLIVLCEVKEGCKLSQSRASAWTPAVMCRSLLTGEHA